ncbi:coniferyl aldehyde dehydrogenase [Neiella marina]|uniref:Aldehyde dehydrogenase n=1 Tax=Neiella holothuriorum TaxID=2870530 RepID=A0ABS7ECT3_9GAMM|nr:coniferyl aldehyde dehydrogenase [Neiella holothuriorum]MBW8190065.1 coniferyl aldehyde dehydrogenase [Neiella holothuriorum]
MPPNIVGSDELIEGATVTTQAAAKTTPTTSANNALSDGLAHLRAVAEQQPNPSLNTRLGWLQALKQHIQAQQHTLAAALNQDYGQRPTLETQLADTLPVLQQLNYCHRKLKRWMKPSRRHVGLALWPANAQVTYQPKGVVGIMVPWNFPLMLSVGPLINALAAGNRVMIKLSELTPQFNQVLTDLLHTALGPDVVHVFSGDVEQAKRFAGLPFDHLLFTGSTQVGQQVMAAAAPNLTPVTLELGGKSPVIITDDCPMALAVKRIAAGKCLNSGQICVAPDYVLCPDHRLSEFVEAFLQHIQQRYPDGLASADLAAIISPQHLQRLQQLLADAEAKGATVQTPSSSAIDVSKRLMLLHLVTGVNDNMRLMQEELFGPILPVLGYQHLSQAVRDINQRPRPLALYVMGLNSTQQQLILQQTCSGGAALNETLLQVGVDDAPFGGIGPSGMGHYHGHEGFLTFSHARTVLRRGRFSTASLLQPPYNRWWQKLLLRFLMR